MLEANLKLRGKEGTFLEGGASGVSSTYSAKTDVRLDAVDFALPHVHGCKLQTQTQVYYMTPRYFGLRRLSVTIIYIRLHGRRYRCS